MSSNLDKFVVKLSKKVINPMRIKELREEKGLTQAELANAIFTSQRNIGRWENAENEPTYSQLVKLADFFNVSIDFLVEREDDFGVKSFNQAGVTLTASEKELIENYRALSDERQEMLIETSNFYYEQCEKNGTLKTNKNVYKKST